MKRKRWLGLGAIVVMLVVLGVAFYKRATRQTDTFPTAGTSIDADVVEMLEASGPWLVSQGSVEDGTVPTILSAGHTTDADLAALSQVRVLFALDLGNSGVTDEGLRHLAELQNLTWLNIRNSHVTGSGVKYLFGLRNLTNFELDARQVNDEVLAHLVAGNQLHINWGEQFTRETRGGGIWITIHPAHPDEVTKLSLVDTSVTDVGLKHLAELKNLSSLTLGQGATDAGLEELSACQKLSSLDVQKSRVSGKGVKALTVLQNLSWLKLDSRQLNDVALENLARAKWLHILSVASSSNRAAPSSEEDVRELDLVDTPVTDSGLIHLAGLRNLASLSLGSGVTDAGLQQLARFKKLHSLSLVNGVTDAGIAR
ncbi:MAG TPA: hypothetical protein VLM40_17560, partial [Gemmata sp.]|nr:hypothetical protein [Gemmata sp.]